MEVPSLSGTHYTTANGHAVSNAVDRNLARAQRDQQIMLRRENRDFDALTQRFASDAGSVETLKKHQEAFQGSLDRAYQDLASRGGQGYAEYAQTLVRARDEFRHAIGGFLESSHGGTGSGGGSTGGGGVDTRNLDRARADLTAINRGLDRQFAGLQERFGSTQSAEIEKLQKDFATRVDAEFQGFVNAGASDYMGFAERLAALHMRFRDEVRGFTQTLEGNSGAGGTNTSGGSAKATTRVDPSGTTASSTTTNNTTSDQTVAIDTPANDRNLARAQRDRDALARGLDREFETLARRVGNNPDAVDSLKKMRDEFLAGLEQRFSEFRATGGQDYMAFASASATARLDLTRQFQAIYQSAGPGIDTKA